MKLTDRSPDWVGDRMIRCARCKRVDDYKFFAPFTHNELGKWVWECDLCQVTRRLEGEYESDLALGYAVVSGTQLDEGV